MLESQIQQEPGVVTGTPIESPKPVRKLPLSWILGILIVFLLGTTAFFGYQTYQLTQEVTEMKKQNPASSPLLSPTPVEEMNNKQAVLAALEGYLGAITTGDCEVARTYLTKTAQEQYQAVECTKEYKSWEGLNEFHSQEEEAAFYAQPQITFSVKLYEQNDQVGTFLVKVRFEKADGSWKTDTWLMEAP